MGIDIKFFREKDDNHPDKIKEIQKKRYKSDEDIKRVDTIVDLDKQWRAKDYEFNQLRKEMNALNKQIGQKKKAKEDCDDLVSQIQELKGKQGDIESSKNELYSNLQKEMRFIGNHLHNDVVIDDNEDNNKLIRTWGEIPKMKITGKPGFAHHHEVLAMIDGYDPVRGSKVSGHRGYFLKGWGALLNMALINYGMHFLMEKKFQPMQTPFFMKKKIMAETCQLSDFDDQLYKVTTGKVAENDDDKDFYLIATSEQPISAYFYNEVLQQQDLPHRFGGYSTCFRKEAGAHGKDTWGIFRIHQFEKIEQFVICEPEQSWNEFDNMVKTAEEYYQSLKLPYRVVSIVSGALNDAAAMKYDLEAWFPGYDTYRELVSCSNCLDFQSRGLNVKMNPKKGTEYSKKKEKPFVHMLNATLCATERTLCCILENYQTPEGVVVPEVLRKFVGIDFIPYVTKKVSKNKQ